MSESNSGKPSVFIQNWMIPKASENEMAVSGYSKRNVGSVEVFIKNN